MILADMGKFIGGKIAAALIFLAVAAGGYWCYQNPEALRAGGRFTLAALMWIVVAAGLPWSSYLFLRPLMKRQAEFQSARSAGAIGVALIALFTGIDVLMAFWLAGWTLQGALTWGVVIVGLAAAAVYNFVICESLARLVDRS